MRRILLAVLLGCASLRADFSYKSRIQVTGGELFDALGAGPHGRDPAIIETRLIRGTKMAIVTRQHTKVIDLSVETITEIDLPKKTYWVIPFDQVKKAIDAAEESAASKAVHEPSFALSVQPSAGVKTFGIIHASESQIHIAGSGGLLTVSVDAWVGVVPGYQQIEEFTKRLAEKMGYAYAAGLADLALKAPQSLQGLDEAAKALNQSEGAPLESTIKIASKERSIADITVELSEFGGGAQTASKFEPPMGFKKVDAPKEP